MSKGKAGKAGDWINRLAWNERKVMVERPIGQDLLEALQEKYNNLVRYGAALSGLFNEDSEYQAYAMSNNYELLLHEYRHLILNQ